MSEITKLTATSEFMTKAIWARIQNKMRRNYLTHIEKANNQLFLRDSKLCKQAEKS